MDREHFICFLGENSVFKFIRISENGALNSSNILQKFKVLNTFTKKLLLSLLLAGEFERDLYWQRETKAEINRELSLVTIY